jgi:Rod binding domain-containing protein
MNVRTTQQFMAVSGARPQVATPARTMPAGDAQTERLTKEAERWVSQTFFGTLLKQMHESPFKSDWLSGGRGGEAFSPLYDQHLADRMARASGRQLVNSIVKQIQGRAAGTATTKPTAQSVEGTNPSKGDTGRRDAATR